MRRSIITWPMLSRAFVAVMVLCGLSLRAADRHWIVFRDKGPGTQTTILSPALRDAAMRTITPRALARRAKVLPPEALVDVQDLPIYQPYLDSIARLGISVVNMLRWNNAVTTLLSAEQITAVRAMSCVQEIHSVASYALKDRDIETIRDDAAMFAKPATPTSIDALSYGYGFDQIHLSHIDALHALGITGNDVLIGQLDTGFRWREHDGMRDAHVLGEYDFVMHDSSTANDSLDDPTQDNHGTTTFSEICSWLPGTMIGGAYNASFLLAKTEDVRSEKHIEEDNYARALEWMEAQGVEVTTSSLGYSIFDSGQTSYTVKDMNGHTTIVAKAVERALKLGVCVVTAAGNSGGDPLWPYVATPGDVDTAITVGAVTNLGVLARFSSRGPTADGRIKPDVCAMGVYTLGASVSGPDKFVSVSGTSLSTPLIASCAALLLSAHPNLTPVQIRDALRTSGDRSMAPDTAYGWGVANVYQAALATGIVISNPPHCSASSLPPDGEQIVCAAVATEGVRDDSVVVHYDINQSNSFSTLPLVRLCHSDFFMGTINGNWPDSVRYYVTVRTMSGRFARKPEHEGTYFSFHIGADATDRSSPLAFEAACATVPEFDSIYPNFPNPFVNSTMVTFGIDRPVHATVDVYNMLGQHCATLFDGDTGGLHSVVWNSPLLPSGLYYVWLRTAQGSLVRKLIKAL